MMKVVLVDDEPYILEGLSVIIDWEKEGFEIVGKTQDAGEALELVKKEEPDLLISDIKMPVMSGLDMIEEMRKQDIFDTYCVLLSGYSDFEYAKRAIKNDCLDYMLKPVDKEELLNVLAKVRQEKSKVKPVRKKDQAVVSSFLDFDFMETENSRWNPSANPIDKQKIDALIRAIETNQKDEIMELSKDLYDVFQNAEPRVCKIAINYMLFELIHLATLVDNTINQQEVIKFICDNAFDPGQDNNDWLNMVSLMQDYGDYLVQLRGNQAQGVLGQVEIYLKENYQENITLKDLGKKYYVNAAYLGQIFKKQYGESFKEYLNKIRIEKAEDLLLHSDMKIYEIAEEVGYKDIDYFINKFISLRGCTPTKFRKRTVSV